MESITVDIVTLTSSDSKFLESLSEIVKQKGGTEGVFLGKKVEADGIFEIFVERASPSVISRTADRLLDKFGGNVGTKVHSVSFEATSPQTISKVLRAPATELVKFSNPTAAFLALFETFLAEFCVPAPGCLGAVIGWEVDEDGFAERKTCVGILGWESVEHHVTATKNEGFEEAAGRFMGEVTGGVEAWHVRLKEL